MLPSQPITARSQPLAPSGKLRGLPDIGALSTTGLVLAYAVFAWGGVLRSDQYRYLLVLGLLAVALSLARPRRQWAPLPGRVLRWGLALLPAYVLMQVAPLPVHLARVLSPARTASMPPAALIGRQPTLYSERFARRDYAIVPARLRIRDRLPSDARPDLAICG